VRAGKVEQEDGEKGLKCVGEGKWNNSIWEGSLITAEKDAKSEIAKGWKN
jgi:hypothetical protein